MFDDFNLRMNLFSIYIFFEIGGTGGGGFRYMFSRFLKEAAVISGNKQLLPAAEKIDWAGRLFSEIGRLFFNAEKDGGLEDKIREASIKFNKIADIEEEAYTEISSAIK